MQPTGWLDVPGKVLHGQASGLEIRDAVSGESDVEQQGHDAPFGDREPRRDCPDCGSTMARLTCTPPPEAGTS